jgi:hypothetical protein
LFMGSFGAPAAGYVLDITGSYDPAWWAGVGLMLLGALVFILADKPDHSGIPLNQTS